LLAAAFGPARRVSAVAPTPASDAPLRLVEFDGGLEARLTPAVDGPCSCRLRVDGEQGALELGEFCGEASPPSARAGSGARGGPDFARGVAEWAQAVAEGRPSPFDADFAVHLAEIAERLRRPERFADAALRSSFAPIAQTLRP
jgi:hypothetical protein